MDISVLHIDTDCGECSCFSQTCVAPQENKNVFSDGVTRIGEYYGGEHKGKDCLLCL